jgi:hypothetical protein
LPLLKFLRGRYSSLQRFLRQMPELSCVEDARGITVSFSSYERHMQLRALAGSAIEQRWGTKGGAAVRRVGDVRTGSGRQTYALRQSHPVGALKGRSRISNRSPSRDRSSSPRQALRGSRRAVKRSRSPNKSPGRSCSPSRGRSGSPRQAPKGSHRLNKRSRSHNRARSRTQSPDLGAVKCSNNLSRSRSPSRGRSSDARPARNGSPALDH